MLTPQFVEDAKLYADYPSDLGNPLANALNLLRADASSAAALRAHRQYPTANMTVYVQPARNVHVNGVNINFAGGSSPTFVAPVSGTRVDLLALNALGVLVIFTGVSGPSNYPNSALPIAEISLASTTNAITDANIVDVRQVFGPRNTLPAIVETTQLGTQAINTPTNTIFDTGGAYILASNSITVYLDGNRMVRGDDYIELNTTQVQFNYPVADTAKVTIVRNDSAGYDISGKVSKTGDIMTGNLRVPELQVFSNSYRIFRDGNRMMFRDVDNPVAVSLSDLLSGMGGGVAINHQEFIAVNGQAIFNLSFNYTTGSDTLQVYKNGILQREGEDYTETGSTSVAFVSAMVGGERVTFHRIAAL